FEMARQRALPDIDCPRCGRRMGKTECHYASGVLADLCPGCAGYWLDRGELESLEVFSERLRLEERRGGQRGVFRALRPARAGRGPSRAPRAARWAADAAPTPPLRPTAGARRVSQGS